MVLWRVRPYAILHLCLFDLKPLLFLCGLTFPFPFLLFLSCSTLLENGFCTDWKLLLFEITGETEAQRVISYDWLKAISWKSVRPEIVPRPPDLVSPTFPRHLTPPPVSLTWSCHITATWPWSILWTNPAQQNCVVMRFTWWWLGRNHESLRKETYKF